MKRDFEEALDEVESAVPSGIGVGSGMGTRPGKKRKATPGSWKPGESGGGKPKPRVKHTRDFRADLISLYENSTFRVFDVTKGEYVETSAAEALRLRVLEFALTGQAHQPDGSVIILKERDASDFARWGQEQISPQKPTQVSVDQVTTLMSSKSLEKMNDSDLATLIEKEFREIRLGTSRSEASGDQDPDTLGSLDTI